MNARLIAIASAAALVLTAPATSVAAWSEPQDLGLAAPGYSALAGDGAGTRVAVFTDGRSVRVAGARHGGRFGPGRIVPGSEARGNQQDSQPVVAMGRHGRALVAWTFFDFTRPPAIVQGGDEGCCFNLMAAVVDGRSISRPQRLAHGFPSPERVGSLAVGPRGELAVDWADDQGLKLRMLSLGGRLGPTEAVAEGGPEAIYFRRGRLRVVYQATGALLERARLGRGHFSAPRTLVELGTAAPRVDVPFAVAANGAAAGVWSTPGGLVAGGRDPGRAFETSPLRTQGTVPDGSLAAAVAPSGRGLVAFTSITDRSLAVASRSPRVRFGPLRDLPDKASWPGLAVAIAPRGSGVLAWNALVQQGFPPPLDVAEIDAGGHVGRRARLATPVPGRSTEGGLQGAFADDAGAVVSWIDGRSLFIARTTR